MEKKFYGPLFVFLRALVQKVNPKYSVQISEKIKGPVVYISHHQNLFGSFIILLWFPKCLHAWILHVFLEQKSCYEQYMNYTFTKRFGWNRILAEKCGDIENKVPKKHRFFSALFGTFLSILLRFIFIFYFLFNE